jgi:predicted nucleotidyltransferase
MTVQKVIRQVSGALRGIPGVVGVVLGGSRARGTNHETSDIDIGIYYDESAGFDVQAVSEIATKLDDQHRENLIYAPGQWGPWVNGGGWLVVQGYHVDFLFRDIHRVARVIDDCLQGKVSSHYQAGHPHAYLNVMYMGEISICQILADPTGQVAELKAKTVPYPKAVKDAIIGYFLFETSFSLLLAEKTADKDDISYVAGHIFRSISCLNQVIFAFNEEYCINEKKAVRMIEGFRVKPRDYKQRVDSIFTSIGTDQKSTKHAVEMLRELIAETEGLVKNCRSS